MGQRRRVKRRKRKNGRISRAVEVRKRPLGRGLANAVAELPSPSLFGRRRKLGKKIEETY
jgi:hypothetical protein